MDERFTVKQAAEMFDKEPKEILRRIQKGGVKGARMELGDEGVTYTLTQESINQLGAMFGLVPKEPKPKQAKKAPPRKSAGFTMLHINGEDLTDAIYETGLSMSEASIKIGYSAGYLASVKKDGRMRNSTATLLLNVLGISPDEYVIPTDDPEEEPEPVEKKESQVLQPVLTAEEIRKAVYNEMVDAALMLAKGSMLKDVTKALLEDNEIQDALQYVLYTGIHGAMVKLDRDGRQAQAALPKILPQKGAGYGNQR